MRKNKKESQTAVASSPPIPQWIELPEDVTANILQRLGAEEMLESAQKVCTTWRRVCLDPAVWRVIHMRLRNCRDNRLPSMCRRAVDRSQGQLLDLSLRNFGDNDLLYYIVYRSSDLKRLTLQGCSGIYREGLVGALEKLPHLEELHLIIMPDVGPEDIFNIGISCPNLKSFTFNQYGFSNPSDRNTYFDEFSSNEYALAIAKNMPNLCHLRLISNPIDYRGLEAILNGCPKLESLDLRQCLDLEIQGALDKRCSEQIKHLKAPLDCVSVIEYEDAAKYEYDWWYDSCSDIESSEEDNSWIIQEYYSLL